MSQDLHSKFFELSNKIESLSEEKKKLQEELDKVMTEIGVGKMFQDPNDLTVAEIHVPTGFYVFNKLIDYRRTRKTGESRGELAMKAAKDAGFTVVEFEKKAKE